MKRNLEAPQLDDNPQENAGNWPTSRQIRLFLLLIFTSIGLYLCYVLTIPFLSSLTWAVVLSVVVLPIHRWIELRLGSRNGAALVSVITVAVLVVVPIALIGQQLVLETLNGAVYLESELKSGQWREAIRDYPTLVRGATWIEQQFDLAGTAGSFAAWLTSTSTSLLRSSFGQLVNIVLTFYLFFFFLRDRQQITAKLSSLSPMTEGETNYVVNRCTDTIHATVFGTLVVAAVQGTLSGLMFWWLDLPVPLFWGTVMGLLAIVPVLGAFVIWVPAAIYLALEGDWSKAIILTIWGAGVVASVDNLLYPMLVSNRLKLHIIPTLFATIGGIIVLGASGVILGPAIFAVTLAFLKILKDRFAKQDLT
jgi:predicted PurR-regulated permease PerM